MIRKLLPGASALAVFAVSGLCLAQPEQPDPAAADASESVDDADMPEEASEEAFEETSEDASEETSEDAPEEDAPEEDAPEEDVEEDAEASASVSVAVGTEPPGAEAQSDAESAVSTGADEQSWFYRPPIEMTLGQGDHELKIGFFGLLAVSLIHDTTRSYGDSIGSNLVARSDTYEGTVGRTQFTSRASRFGFDFLYSEIGGITPYGMLEADFSGDQPTNEVSTERTYYDSPTFRMRHAFLELQNDYADVLAGQTDDVFGWQNNVSSTFRHTQVRLSHTFGESGPIGLDMALAAMRPAQRDSQVPDAQAGLRVTANNWNGMYTRNGIPDTRPLSLGVSGVGRQFDVDAFTPPPTQSSNNVMGWGASVDAVVPVIPAENEYDRGNKLTLAGSFVMGTGIGDLMRANGGAVFPPLPNPARASPPPLYDGNVDEGLVTFDRLGVLHTIDWQAWRVDVQYYLPPHGRVRLYAVYSEAVSDNMFDLYPQGGAEIELLNYVADASRYAEFNVYWDVTPAVRVGAAGIYTSVRYLDEEEPYNIRGKLNGWLYF